MTRRFHVPAILALVAALALVIAGCAGGASSGADAEAARACVQAAMEDVRTLAPDARQTVVEELESHAEKPLAKMGVSADDLVDDYFRDFSFEVGDAAVAGNSAQVGVNVTCRPVRDIVTQLVGKCAGKWESAAPTLWELLDGSEAQQVQITVSCTKGADGSWSCDEGLKRALTQLCLK